MSTPELTARIPLDERVVSQIVETFRRVVEETIKREIAVLGTDAPTVKEAPPLKPAAATTGVTLTEDEKLKAADLRVAFLLGKIPESSGLLIDGKSTAKLLGISYRTLYRLHSMKAVPEPVRLSENMIRWRVAEILEWVEAGCQSQKDWVYPKPAKGRR